jgi:hypothetical protein
MDATLHTTAAVWAVFTQSKLWGLLVDTERLSAFLVQWVLFGVLGTLALYVGFGFYQCANRARKDGLSQRRVLWLDAAISIVFYLLDFALNTMFYSVVCLDFRIKFVFRTVTQRLSAYNSNPNEWAYRRALANFFAAFLDGKDIAGDHIKGDNSKFSWLD